MMLLGQRQSLLLNSYILMCALGAALVSPVSALAAATCPMTYETFETAVPHLDAESCPDQNLKDKAFCRISVGGDQAHVFYFASDGEQCLLKVESYDDEDMDIQFRRKP